MCACCVFVRASLHTTRTEEKPTRCHWMLYWTYDTLNTYRALLCPSSRARDYKCVLLPPMVCTAWLLVVGGQVQSSRLWVQEERCCPKHAKRIISAIKHSVTSSLFFFPTQKQTTYV